MPLQRRIPKRGFKNFNRVAFQVVNVGDLERIEGGSAIGHVRYSTTGDSVITNAQPFLVNHLLLPMPLALLPFVSLHATLTRLIQ